MTVRTVGIGSSVPLNATAKLSNAFNVQSTVMRIVAKGASAHVAITTGPLATNTDFFILGGEEEQIALTKGSQVVVGITTGTTTILEAPEGTQMPFIIGDYVTLDTANDAEVQMADSFASKLILTGGYAGASLTVGTLSTSTTTVDASGLAADFDMTAGAVDTGLTVTTAAAPNTHFSKPRILSSSSVCFSSSLSIFNAWTTIRVSCAASIELVSQDINNTLYICRYFILS